ncbi:MAG: hypothetical protein JNM69_32600 [Archangium sp.]|nr:hypothetical protein [Archangium sp.]
MLTALVTLIACSTDGGVVVHDEGFTWRLPDDVSFEGSADAGVEDGDWGRRAAGRSWTAKGRDESLWQLTRWSVPDVPKGLSAKNVLRRWRGNHGCVSTVVDGGVAMPGATLQFTHAGSCVGGDVYVRRVAVFSLDSGAVVYEFNAVRFVTLRAPSEPRVPLSTSLEAFVRSVELR